MQVGGNEQFFFGERRDGQDSRLRGFGTACFFVAGVFGHDGCVHSRHRLEAWLENVESPPVWDRD